MKGRGLIAVAAMVAVAGLAAAWAARGAAQEATQEGPAATAPEAAAPGEVGTSDETGDDEWRADLGPWDGPGYGMGGGMGMGTGMGTMHDGMGAGPGGRFGHGIRGGMGRGFGRGHRMGPRALEALDLTPPQRERIEALHERQLRTAIQSRADLATAGLDLRKLLRAANPDRRAIDAQIDRMSDLRASLHKARVATMLDVRAVLTPEQREKLETLGPGAMRRGAGFMQRGRDAAPPDDRGGRDGTKDDDGGSL
jgi:Spy/CpxP family protein refolding chaperone